MKKARPNLTPLCTLLASAWLSLAAQAQPAEPAAKPGAETAEKKTKEKAEEQKAQKLDTVLVTSSKRNEAAHRLPYNVSAQTEQQLRDENITDLKKLIAASPSIDAPPNSARFTDSVTVRGLNISSVSANNVEWFARSTMSYYLDDAPLPNIGYRIKDIARVETLLGPQGTLYGGGALGGTIRYITNKPQLGKTEGRLSTSFYQTRHGGLSNDSDGVFNLPLGDRMALRVALARLDEKGYTDRYAATPSYLSSTWTPKPDANQKLYKDDDWQRADTGRVSLLWRLTPDLELTVSHAQQSQLAHGSSGAQLLKASGNPARYQAPLAFDQQTVLSPYPEYSDRDFNMSTLDLSWNLGFARLHSSTSRYSDSRVGQADYLGTGSFFYGDLGYSQFRLGSSKWLGNTGFISFDNRYEGTLHETRLVSQPGMLSWIAGLYHADQKRSQQFSEWMPGFEAFKSTAGRGRKDEGYMEVQSSDYRESALYGELSLKASERLTLTGGARLFAYKDRTTTQVEDYAFDLVDGVVKGEEKDSGKAYFKLNAAYQLNPDLLGYATFSQGFRRGGANGFRTQGSSPISADVRSYKPDQTDNYEIGIKGFLADRQIYLQTGIYRIDWKDPQTYFSQDINGFPVWGTTNGPKAVSNGWEFAGRWRFLPDWEASLSTTYTDAKWAGTKTVCLYADNSECRTYAQGGKLGGSAPWKHSLGLRWSGGLDSGHDLWVAGQARYVGVKASDRGDSPDASVFSYRAYTTANLSAGVSHGSWDLSLWVENLSNNRELVSFQGTSAVAERVGLRAIYLTPRTIGMNLSYRFR